MLELVPSLYIYIFISVFYSSDISIPGRRNLAIKMTVVEINRFFSYFKLLQIPSKHDPREPPQNRKAVCSCNGPHTDIC